MNQENIMPYSERKFFNPKEFVGAGLNERPKSEREAFPPAAELKGLPFVSRSGDDQNRTFEADNLQVDFFRGPDEVGRFVEQFTLAVKGCMEDGRFARLQVDGRDGSYVDGTLPVVGEREVMGFNHSIRDSHQLIVGEGDFAKAYALMREFLKPYFDLQNGN